MTSPVRTACKTGVHTSDPLKEGKGPTIEASGESVENLIKAPKDRLVQHKDPYALDLRSNKRGIP